VPYPEELGEALARELVLDGGGRLLDIGCGPGSLTLLLAPRFGEAVGVDADPEMLAEGRRRAVAVGIKNVEWVHRRAEDMSLDLGSFRVATLSQSFHWMNRERVAGLVRELLTTEGALVHVHATTHQGIEGQSALPHPRPPRREIEALVSKFLGTRRRAGRATGPGSLSMRSSRGRRRRGSTGRPGLVAQPGSRFRAWSSPAARTKSLPACSRCPTRHRTSSETAPRSSSRSCARCSLMRTRMACSANRCARSRQTSGAFRGDRPCRSVRASRGCTLSP
jgi:hypothetical protein